MIRLSSGDDPRLADYRLLADPAALTCAGVFVAEGRLVVRRLLTRPRFRTRSILVTETAFDALQDILSSSDLTTPVYVVGQSVMNRVAGFNMHRGCLALAERPHIDCMTAADLQGVRRVIVLEGVNNPDNVGGIFRSAEALGAELIVLGPDCSDPLYRKAVRTSMAATLQLPYVHAGAWPDALGTLRSAGFCVLALTPAPDARPLDGWPRDLSAVALLVGAEGDGLTPEAIAAATDRVRIPMRGTADSLNVTTAASIALYHFCA